MYSHDVGVLMGTCNYITSIGNIKCVFADYIFVIFCKANYFKLVGIL
jgi:hypothetical protein